MDVLHTAIWVNDIEAMTEFYCEGLDLEHTREFVTDGDVNNYFVAGESDTEIQFRYDDRERDIDPSGIDHVAIAVADVDAKLEELTEEYGSEVQKGPKTLADKGVRIAFVTDPEGYVVELIEELE